MIMKAQSKIIIAGIAVITIVMIIISSRNRLFVPQNMIDDYSDLEISVKSELVSCQLDCSINDGQFHEECIGFNGCKDSFFLRDKDYCEKNSDCAIDLGCCLRLCEGDECLNAKICPASNNRFIESHRFGCENSVACNNDRSCNGFKNSVCVSNKCRIIE